MHPSSTTNLTSTSLTLRGGGENPRPLRAKLRPLQPSLPATLMLSGWGWAFMSCRTIVCVVGVSCTFLPLSIYVYVKGDALHYFGVLSIVCAHMRNAQFGCLQV